MSSKYFEIEGPFSGRLLYIQMWCGIVCFACQYYSRKLILHVQHFFLMINLRIRNMSKTSKIKSYKINLLKRTFCLIAVAQLLRRCATNRKVAGSIQDGVTGIFH